MINYSAFNTTSDHSFNVHNAIAYCRTHGEDVLVFDKGRYDFYPDMASEDVLCVSNHDIYGIQRIAFLIKDMKDFTVDGGGSEFVFHGGIIPFTVKDSENVTVKNLSIDHEDTMMRDLEVINVGEGYFDALVTNSDKQYVSDGMLYYYDGYGNTDRYHYMTVRSFGDSKSFISESTDEFRVFNQNIRFEDLGERKLRIYNAQNTVKTGMHLLTRGTVRFACNMVLTGGKNATLENVTMYKSYSMGVLAQKVENVSIDHMTVKAKDDCLYSLNTDATHFVHCKGLIKVTNSEFSEQQDDALNIHGVFTRIVDKTDDHLLIRYMHPQAKGLNIYEKGDKIAVLDSKSLIPKGHYVISDVEVVNMNYTKLYIEGGTADIQVGDDVEDLTFSCDLIFENNRVINNRARGILIAAKGNVSIKNNYFNTPGVAILFESDGEKWFESGATTHVEISKNVFESCKYSKGWGANVIEIKPRERFDEGNYYHKLIDITENSFTDCKVPLLYADNAERVVFKDNSLVNCTAFPLAVAKNCGEFINDFEK